MKFLLSNVFLASFCIFVQRRKYLRGRYFQIFLLNGGATKKSQDGWPLTFCLKEQYAPSFYRSCFKYGVRSLNTQHFYSYCSSKNVLFMGQNDLDPQTIDLNLNVYLAIEILYQYEYVAQVERLNYGTITACLRKDSAFRCKISRNKSKVLTEMTSHEILYIFKINVSYLDNTQFIQFIESILPYVTKMKKLFTLCFHVIF